MIRRDSSMAASVPNLRLLDQPGGLKELDLASELFHRINRIIPVEQSVLTIPPQTPVRNAIELMREHGYSQIPVVDKSEVLGVFSFRSFAKGAAGSNLEDWTKQ